MVIMHFSIFFPFHFKTYFAFIFNTFGAQSTMLTVLYLGFRSRECACAGEVTWCTH